MYKPLIQILTILENISVNIRSMFMLQMIHLHDELIRLVNVNTLE